MKRERTITVTNMRLQVRFDWRGWLVLGAMVFSLWAGVGPAQAHQPIWGAETGVTTIPNLSTSFAVYRDLKAPAQVDYYALAAKAGDRLWAGINIPAVPGLEHYGVTVALFGPGLPLADPAAVPFEYPDGVGAVLFNSQPGADFFEPFTQTNYWGRQRFDLTLPETGTYYLAVWNPAGQTGKYVMDTGRAEVFGPGDIFNFPIWWVRVHLFFGHGPYLAGLAAALVVLGVAFVAWRRRARATLAARPAAQL